MVNIHSRIPSRWELKLTATAAVNANETVEFHPVGNWNGFGDDAPKAAIASRIPSRWELKQTQILSLYNDWFLVEFHPVGNWNIFKNDLLTRPVGRILSRWELKRKIAVLSAQPIEVEFHPVGNWNECSETSALARCSRIPSHWELKPFRLYHEKGQAE